MPKAACSTSSPNAVVRLQFVNLRQALRFMTSNGVDEWWIYGSSLG